jgi:anti-sigma-K factor RskA
MTELGHRECADVLGAYALGALSQDEAERVRRHIERCPTCRDELDGLRAAVDALPASVEQIEPPRGLKQRLMAIVEAEAELLRAAGDAADRPAGEAARPRGRRWLAAPRWRPAAAFGLACAIAVAVIVLSAGGAGPRTIRAQVSPSLRAAGVRASVQVRGSRAELVVSGLPLPAADHVDELWVQHGASVPQPAGTFVVRSGSVEASRPVRSGDLVLVTVEPGGGTPAPTTSPLLVARV